MAACYFTTAITSATITTVLPLSILLAFFFLSTLSLSLSLSLQLFSFFLSLNCLFNASIILDSLLQQPPLARFNVDFAICKMPSIHMIASVFFPVMNQPCLSLPRSFFLPFCLLSSGLSDFSSAKTVGPHWPVA